MKGKKQEQNKITKPKQTSETAFTSFEVSKNLKFIRNILTLAVVVFFTGNVRANADEW